MKNSLSAGLFAAILHGIQATPIPVINSSGEINGGVSPTPLNDASVPGWNGSDSSAQVIANQTDYGNGAWRISFEDSDEIFQMTPQLIETGASYSLRFDASVFSGSSTGGSFLPVATLIEGPLLNGDFNADPSATDTRTFAETPEWFNIGTSGQNMEATRNGPAATLLDGSRNAVISVGSGKIFAIDTGHDLSSGEAFRASYQWRDALNWTNETDKVRVSLFTTSDNTPTGSVARIETIESGLSNVGITFQSEQAVFAPVPASVNGKRLFVSFSGPLSGEGFARLDNFVLERGTTVGSRTLTADLYVDEGDTRQVVATRTYDFKSPTSNNWNHYHLAVPAGALDAHAGKTVGIQFRASKTPESNFQSVDNVRLDFWPAVVADGSFADDWNATPDQTWAGPGYWANRLQDWEVSSGRVQCINGTRDRLTLHRPGTSIRGNGGDFSLSVRTGLNSGSHSSGSRSGFLIGGAPNVDWRGALLVHDGLGRDFGLFIGLDGDGTLLVEDYSTGATTALSSTANPSGFGPNTRLDLNATYDGPSGNYTLTLEALGVTGASLGSVSVTVPSDRILGAFGLLNHRGGNNATYWFDDFSGTGSALQPEPDRHLAILGAMHTLSKGTLKLTAQLSPLDLASTPPVALDVWNGGGWQQIDTVTIDNTDNYSSYTATFTVPDWNDSVDTDYRIRVKVGGTDYEWSGTIRKDPVDKNEIVIASTTCQRITDSALQSNGFDWTPIDLWQPHVQTYDNLAKHDPDVLLAHGDQIYEGQPTPVDAANYQLDYLYKWNLWVLQVRDLSCDIPTIAIPDDHDIYQGNLWGEGGVSSNNQNSGGYVRPAVWVKMVERTQTSNLPAADPYNPVQPPPGVAQGIEVYFTGVTYGRLGFAVLEDRKFKTGRTNPPTDINQQFLLGDRQHDFLREWNKDWAGQDLKLVVSQSPMGNLRTHASTGYGFGLNDQDTHGWPVHRRNEAWELWRVSRMFQLAGDQHLATLAHHGVDSPKDAGISFTVPAIANFFPRSFDPAHNTGGTTPIVSPYRGDYFFDGNGTLPDGTTPNLTANDPHHFEILGAGNPNEYYERSNGITPINLHNRGAGYGITRVDKTTREITFECWPIHADPDEPSTGSQFPDWPQTYVQTDNDGRLPTGHLPVIDTQWRKNAVVRVYDESSNELVNAMRVRGNLYRPPVHDNGATYRVEIAYDDETVSETRTAQAATPPGAPAIHSFLALQPSIVTGGSATLRWDTESPTTLTIDQAIGNVMRPTVDGIGYLEVSPTADTTYTLTLNGDTAASTTVRVFAGKSAWLDAHFTPAEQLDPLISGDDVDPDLDGFTNDDEFRFQTDPRDPASQPRLESRIVEEADEYFVEFSSPFPLDAEGCSLLVEAGESLTNWSPVPSNHFMETARIAFPSEGTTRVTLRLATPVPETEARKFYRGRWLVY